MVAAVTLQALNPFRTGKIVLYQVTYSSGWHGFEILSFILLGILGGLYGALFIKLNMRIAHYRRNRSPIKSPIVEVILITFFSSLINYPSPFMRAQTSELVYYLFAECSSTPSDPLGLCKTSASSTITLPIFLLVAAILGFALAALTFGLQIPAGIILPSLAIGALYGRALGIIAQSFHLSHPDFPLFSTCEPDRPCITPGTYAIIGAASALGGATRMTVSIVVIMFELTGALTYVLPIMIAVMISKWVGDAVGGTRGIYESWIHFNEYPFLDNADSTPIPDVPANQIMTRTPDLITLPSTGHTISSLTTLLSTTPYRGFPVILSLDSPILLGYISRTELTFALKTATSTPRNLPADTVTYFSHQPLADPRDTLDLRPWMDQTPITLNAQSSLQLTVNMFQKLGLRYILFVSKGRLEGLLTKKDIWYVLDGADAGKSNSGAGGGIGRRGYVGAGVLREEGEGAEERGLLAAQRGSGDGDVDGDGDGDDGREDSLVTPGDEGDLGRRL
jgi:chloride channel 3/4/5